MSMIVTTVVPDGIVMAADSATTHFTYADMKNIFTGNFEEAARNARTGGVPPARENVLTWSTLSRYTNKINVTKGNNIAILYGNEMMTEDNISLDPFVEDFCLKNSFDNPKDAAQALLAYLRGGFAQQDAVFMIGGYNRTDSAIPFPETWHINIKSGEMTQMTGHGQYGMLFCSANEYFKNFRELINKNAYAYKLQDAVDVTMFAFDVAMKCERLIDLRRFIWPPIDVLVITQTGVQWIQRKRPEVKGYVAE
jgi:hypothetical protein